jgi:hypothetical protein
MSDRAATYVAWPELLKPATAAALLDISESTFRSIFPILAARYGLRVYGLSGPKFRRDNLLGVIESLAERQSDVVVDKAGGTVRIGADVYPIRSTRSGKSGRGRPASGGESRTP